MKKLLWAILLTLLVGAGVIIWQVWDAKATASADGLRDAQAEVVAYDASLNHELLNQRYHLAEIVWEDHPYRVRQYRLCLEMEEHIPGEAFGDTPTTDKNCKKLQKMLDRATAKE
jgi:hypothetical protein